MRIGIAGERALLVSTREGIRLLGGAAGIWDRRVVAGWIRPAVRGRVNYYRYRDIIALAERLCHELPPRRAAQQRWLDRQRKSK
jgi:hypothetical protein